MLPNPWDCYSTEMLFSHMHVPPQLFTAPSCSCGIIFSDVYIRLNDSIIPNRGYVKISDLSFATLDCLTTDNQHEGNWISPDGTTVDSSGSVPGFRTTRGPLIVRLLRTSGTPQQGIYQYVVQNDTAVLYTVHVGLYNSGEGVLFVCL